MGWDSERSEKEMHDGENVGGELGRGQEVMWKAMQDKDEMECRIKLHPCQAGTLDSSLRSQNQGIYGSCAN